jgi:phosphate transport system permease protein
MTATATPRRIRTIGARDTIAVLGSLLAAILLTIVAFALTPLSGALGFVVVSYVLFLGVLYVVGRRTIDRKAGADRVVTVLISTAALVVIATLVLIIGMVLVRGVPNFRLGFLTRTLEGVDPSSPATVGGAWHAISGTLSQVALATLVSVPFGIATAVYLQEIRGRFAGVVRVLVDAMSGIPSIVAGLFIYTIWVVGTGSGFSGFSAALALGMLMLPTVARTSEEMLKLVDPSLREASLALGAPEWRTVLRVVLPTARTGIVTAVILGIARVAGETAPLLMTAFGNDRAIGPVGSLSEPQSALPLYIFQQFQQDQRDRAWTGAFVLIAIVVVLFLCARLLARPRANRSH